MRRAFMLGAAALVASCVFAQDVFAQRGGVREAGFRAAAPGVARRLVRRSKHSPVSNARSSRSRADERVC